MTDKNAALLRAQVIEECARVCEKRAETRWREYGITEYDTNASYYPSSHEWCDTADEEAEGCAAAIRALATAPQDATSNAEGRHPDDIAVDRFAAAMKEKLAVKRAQGRSGWDDPEQCNIDYLVRLFHDHVSKGDPIDIGNFAMMLWIRMATTNLPTKYKRIPSAPPPQQQDDCVRVPIEPTEEMIESALAVFDDDFKSWDKAEIVSIYKAFLTDAKKPKK